MCYPYYQGCLFYIDILGKGSSGGVAFLGASLLSNVVALLGQCFPDLDNPTYFRRDG